MYNTMMTYPEISESLKRLIIRKFIKNTRDEIAGFIRYKKQLYYVNLRKDLVVPQREYK